MKLSLVRQRNEFQDQIGVLLNCQSSQLLTDGHVKTSSYSATISGVSMSGIFGAALTRIFQEPFPSTLEQQEIATVFADIFRIVTLATPKIMPLVVGNMSKRTEPSRYLEKLRDVPRLKDSLNTCDKVRNFCPPLRPGVSYFEKVK